MSSITVTPKYKVGDTVYKIETSSLTFESRPFEYEVAYVGVGMDIVDLGKDEHDIGIIGDRAIAVYRIRNEFGYDTLDIFNFTKESELYSSLEEAENVSYKMSLKALEDMFEKLWYNKLNIVYRLGLSKEDVVKLQKSVEDRLDKSSKS